MIPTWFLIVFVFQDGNPQLIQVRPPELKDNILECVQDAVEINADQSVAYLAACLPSYKKVNSEPAGRVS
tara:strand:- start:419 stop:628 length:210 start_codon:yes stop_codon:yes gene_type:complete